jgi:hypothetical protein
MKSITSLILVSLLSSCMGYRGGQNPTLLAIGLDANKITLPGGAIFEGLNMSKALGDTLKQVKGMWMSYLLTNGLKYMAGKYYSLEGQKLGSSTTIKLEELRNAKSLAEGEQALKALQLAPQ